MGGEAKTLPTCSLGGQDQAEPWTSVKMSYRLTHEYYISSWQLSNSCDAVRKGYARSRGTITSSS